MEKTQKKVLWVGMAVVVFLGVVLVVSYRYGKSLDMASVRNTPQTQEKSAPPLVDLSEKSIPPAVTESNDGWKKYISNENRLFTTKDWQTYSIIGNDNASFSIKYPENWKLSGKSVFENSDGKKVAEFSPGMVMLQLGQNCFDVKEESPRSKLISQAHITIDDRQGSLRVKKSAYEPGGYWYPNIYCVTEGDKAFVMAFYEEEPGSKTGDLYKEILSTLEFE